MGLNRLKLWWDFWKDKADNLRVISTSETNLRSCSALFCAEFIVTLLDMCSVQDPQTNHKCGRQGSFSWLPAWHGGVKHLPRVHDRRAGTKHQFRKTFIFVKTFTILLFTKNFFLTRHMLSCSKEQVTFNIFIRRVIWIINLFGKSRKYTLFAKKISI